MPPLSDKELEERLTAAGSSLLHPPSSLKELLPLLDQIEDLLSKVEQSPAKSMQDALSPLMKALVTEDLVKHSNIDVKVGVASCISEITRITAPDAPYDDDKMKDVFQLIVSSFENLSDVSSRSHVKRATILETVAKVRSCVIMLDLECEQMIIEMFQHFLKAISDHHAEVILASMETIMTLVLEESEDISPDLLNPILATLKRNDEATPISKKLAESVIRNSADKIRPYLTQAVKSLDASLDDFSEVVASVCQENTGTVRHSNESILKDQPVVEKKLTIASPAQDPVIQVTQNSIEEITFEDKDHTMTKSPKPIVSNGTNGVGTDQIMTDANSSEKADSDHQLDTKSTSKEESDDCGAQTPEKLEAKAEHAEVQQVPYNHEIPGEHSSPSEVKTVEPAQSLDEVEDTSTQILPSKVLEDEAVNVISPTQSGSLPIESQAKKDSPAKREENLVGDEIESDDTASKKTSEGESTLEEKKQRHLGNKRAEETSVKDKSLTEDGASKNDNGATSDSEARSPDKTEKLGDASSNKTEGRSKLRKGGGKKKGRMKPKIEKNVLKFSAKEDRGKDTETSPRSPLKSTEDEDIQEETPRMSTKRKRTPGTEKGSETVAYGENLVGSKVRVYWPKDRMYYEGTVASFDSAKKKHKVLYTDGDREVLNLKKEKWEIVDDNLVSDGDQDIEHSSHDTSPDMQKKKKGNTNPETSGKRQKMEGSPKSKSKIASTKPGGKSKDDGKAESESKDNKSKPSKKSVDDTVKSKDHSQKAKATGRSNVDVAKTSSHSKQDSHKTPKSKGKTPQSGKTLHASDTKMLKSSSSKGKETDRMKGKASDSAKSGEGAKGKETDRVKGKASDSAKSGEVVRGKETDRVKGKASDSAKSGEVVKGKETDRVKGKASDSAKSGEVVKGKETDRVKGKASDLAKSEVAKGKSLDTPKSRDGETKSGKKRRR